jgi:hypothetical protein
MAFCHGSLTQNFCHFWPLYSEWSKMVKVIGCTKNHTHSGSGLMRKRVVFGQDLDFLGERLPETFSAPQRNLASTLLHMAFWLDAVHLALACPPPQLP